MLCRVAEDVRNNLHRRRWRINIGVTNHELFKNVVLDRAGQFVLRNTLFFGGHNVARQNRQHGAVHGHRDRNLVERDLVEEDLHVFDGVNRYARLADVTYHTGVVRIVTAVGGQIESNRHPLAAGSQCLAVESVRRFSGREAGVLTDRPRLNGVHGGLWAAQERGKARQCVSVLQTFDILLGIERLDGQAFRRVPVEAAQVAFGRLFSSGLFPGFNRLRGGFIRMAHGKPHDGNS